MKTILINGSPRHDGNTFEALSEVASALVREGIEAEIVWIGKRSIPGCTACMQCKRTGVCIFNTEPYSTIREKMRTADALVVGTPVYFGGPNGSLCALLDRLFYSSYPSGQFLAYKPAAAVAVCRRAGAAAAIDRINKYFTALNMPVVSSQYWNLAYGRDHGEVLDDPEGLQTMRTLGRNMAWLLKKISTDPTLPPQENRIFTNFIR